MACDSHYVNAKVSYKPSPHKPSDKTHGLYAAEIVFGPSIESFEGLILWGRAATILDPDGAKGAVLEQEVVASVVPSWARKTTQVISKGAIWI